MKCTQCDEESVAKGFCVRHYYNTPEQKIKISNRAVTRQEILKTEVLTHYGKHGKLKCCWEGCNVTDVDMLTLDHVNDDGFRHIENSGRRLTGIRLYIWAKRNKFPDTVQTLCGSHQLKKLISKRKEDRLQRLKKLE
jgi:hypothetical protein